MSWIDGWLHRARVLWSGERYADEQAREMEFHLDLDAQARGGEADDAERAARRAFGNVTVRREEARAASALDLLDRVRQDARYALRALRRQPAFTAMVVVTLALGFGVNAAMFSLVDAIFLRVPDGIVAPDRVRRVYHVVVVFQQRHQAYGGYEYPQYRAMLAADSTLPIALVGQLDSVKVGIGSASDVNGSRVIAQESEVSRSYFPLLGVRPLMGRFFLPEEDSVATPTPVAVISDAMWRGAFASDPHVLGRQITIDRRPFTIVGVAARDFRGIDLDACDLWVPWNTHPASSYGMPGPWYETFGISARLIARPRSPTDEARIDGIVQRAMRSTIIKYFYVDSATTVETGPIIEARGPETPETAMAVTRRVAWVAVLVLAIAVANVVNLLLLRAARRKREMALRRALGVSRARLLGQLTIEGMLLAVLGGAAAILVAAWAGTALRALVLPNVHWAHPAITGSTIVFLLVLSLIVGLAAGIAPALHGDADDLLDALRAGQRDSGYRGSRARAMLLGLQAALCAVLLVGAGLFVRSLQNVRGIDIGYDVQNLTSFTPQFSDRVTNHGAELRQTIPLLASQLAGAPGVRAVGYSSVIPMGGMNVMQLFLPDGRPMPREPEDRMGPSGLQISPNFFDVVGAPVIAGRAFSSADGPAAPSVMMVNQTFARMVWPGENALGKCVILGAHTNPCSTVVGVVRDVHRSEVIEPPVMFYYAPLSQPSNGRLTVPDVIIVRSNAGAKSSIIPLIARRMRDAFPSAEDITVSPMSAQVDRQLRTWELGTDLFTAFGVLAFIVAGVGVYSVVAYGVAQRTHEMGIRLALGARGREIVDLVLADGLRAVLVGSALGLLAAALMGRFIASLLFGVTPDDPSIMILVAVALCVLGAVGSLVPALRAARVDPMVALRSD